MRFAALQYSSTPSLGSGKFSEDLRCGAFLRYEFTTSTALKSLRVDSRINYLLLASALLGTFFSGTATRIVAISMPTVARSLETDLIGISWALLAYQLSNIGLSRIFGRIADLWGREKIFALGFFVFAVSSLPGFDGIGLSW